MKKPTEIITREFKLNRCGGRAVKKYSYVFTLCEKGGHTVQAIRAEHYVNRDDARKEVVRQFPGWNIKSISRLYDDDFSEEGSGL